MNETRTIASPFEAVTRNHEEDGNPFGSLDAMGEVIRKYRKEAGLTQAELAEQIDVKRNTVVAWESGKSRPEMETLLKVSHLLSIPITELFHVGSEDSGMPAAERRLLRLYQEMDEKDQRILLSLAKSMIDEAEMEKARMLEEDFHILGTLPTSAAAGTGNEYLDNNKPLLRFYRKNKRFARADFVCKVKGHSMEPAYPDGCLVYCRKSDDAPDGSVVICDSNDGRLIKQKMGNVLISINPGPKYILKKYPDDDVTIRGIVLGIVPEEDVPDKNIEPELEDIHFEEVTAFRKRNGIWDD